MNTILIAEDEKFIRRGLRTMIERSPIPTGEILEARDGKEALELLYAHPVDLLVTDIRMPGMDGIELVSRLKELERPPMVLAISGYDDFSYAVEMLRGGAQDYLLKPVERERLYEALEKLEARYRQEQAAREEQDRQLHRILRQLMLEGAGEERSSLLEKVGESFFSGPYVGFCIGAGAYLLPEGALRLRGTGSVTFFAVPAEECEPALPFPLGRSGICEGVGALHDCYQAAYAAWKRSFFTGELCEAPVREGNRTPSIAARQLAGLVGLSRGEEVSRLLAAEADGVSRGGDIPRCLRAAVRGVHPAAAHVLSEQPPAGWRGGALCQYMGFQQLRPISGGAGPVAGSPLRPGGPGVFGLREQAEDPSGGAVHAGKFPPAAEYGPGQQPRLHELLSVQPPLQAVYRLQFCQLHAEAPPQ